MRRRDFITLLGGAAAWPELARAQQPAMPLIGYLSSGSQQGFASRLAAFRRGLQEIGYREGQNVAIEYRWAEGHDDRLPAMAAELVQRRVNVLATPGGVSAARAAKAATAAIPIVFETGADPVAAGLVGSLSRPGGNLTGVTSLNVEVGPKRFELLRQLKPDATAVALLVNPGNPNSQPVITEARQATRALNLELHLLQASSDSEFEGVFAKLAELRLGREFIVALGGATVAWPLAARAQQSPPVIGFLGTGAASEWPAFVAAFRQGLAEVGYEDGRNLKIEFRWAEGQSSRLPGLASDLGSRAPSAIVASVGIAAARAVKAASPSIPTVFVMGGDPVGLGMVASLNRPGGNITGVSFQLNVLAAKRVGLLRELLPTATVLGLLVNPSNPNAEFDTREAQAAARSLGQQTHVVQVRSESDFDAAFASLVERRAAALFVASDPLFLSRRDRLVMLAAAHRLPAIYDRRELAAAGGLISYGSNFAEAHRLVGGYVGRILRGEKPGDLPVVQATKFELVLNLKTAKALGLDVPDKLLALADEVIE